MGSGHIGREGQSQDLNLVSLAYLGTEKGTSGGQKPRSFVKSLCVSVTSLVPGILVDNGNDFLKH